MLARAYRARELEVRDLEEYFRSAAHLYTLGIDTNAVCNLACKYCYLERYNSTSAPHYVDLEVLKARLVEVVERGIDLVALVGKEPFADERGILVLEHLDGLREADPGLRFGLVTNGVLADRWIERLPESTSYVSISLDGTEAANDAVRGAGVYERATTNARLLVDHGFEVWISSVLHSKTKPADLTTFVRSLAEEQGCRRFYFSPIRNFTGTLESFLLSYNEISRLEERLTLLADTTDCIETIILDHPYEAVWRDYFDPIDGDGSSCLDRLVTDDFGNTLEPLSPACFRKLDVFPHGPWGTARIDARGEYLPDVESRTYRNPRSMGNIADADVSSLHARSLESALRPMLTEFLRHMDVQTSAPNQGLALQTVSIPRWSQTS